MAEVRVLPGLEEKRFLAIKVALNHRSHYRYDRPVSLAPQVIRLRPAPHCRTPILSYSLRISPSPHFLNWQQDPHSNYLARLVFPEKTSEFLVEVDLNAELSVINPFDYFLEPYAEHYPFEYEAELKKDLTPYRQPLPAGSSLEAFFKTIPREKRRVVDFLVDLNRRVQQEIRYVIRLEPGIQTCEESLALGSGSCRDSSWLLVQLLRHLGFAARFVSGYLIQLTPDVKPIEGPPGASRDFTDLHAWTEVYLPGAGWVGFDPTSGLLAAEGHIPLACTPDASSAAPISGRVDPCEVDFVHNMSVRRIDETPRVTKPYTPGQWARIEELARGVDEDLAAADVRLTMGGEPTFVGIDEPDSPEWSSDALGDRKRERAGVLIGRLREKFAPGGLLHSGQGKWYPGETLPRWTLACFWRADEVPIWEDQRLIADERTNYGFGIAEAERYLEALTRRLQVNASHMMPAYEDTLYYLWKERRLPANVDVADSKLANPREREQLARVLEAGPGEPAGFALPLRRWRAGQNKYWSSQPWFLRPERLLLIAGDSPIGFRLPLDSLPWVAPEDAEYDHEPDPFASHEELPPYPERRPDLFESAPVGGAAGPEPPKRGQSFKHGSRPALCVQPRDGRIHVFLPPTDSLADFLDLVAALEDTCSHLKMPILIEGYAPSSDDRLRVIKVTPDPGVIEVNVPPARNWRELKSITTILYEEARQSRLATEKFMLDGTHVGTGGGNHIVIGGPSPADSPFLRRPGLLRSLVAFWQNHPSLSYLFSSRFIGPTSQHPRVDEARTDSLYELEIAFHQVPAGDSPPWLIDRLFRNLLIDVTGNTHRAEFCIDKLYPPDQSGSRLGLVELRAFEMPPHPQMSLAQQLLLRAIVATFWRQPFQGALVPWGTSLHDRFMLPHFITEDFNDVLAYLHRFGYAVEADWFRSHIDFRFPLIGRVVFQGIELELRAALEPWHVLGEEAGQNATVRNVDSSMERLQVKVSGMAGDRYVVTCNSRRVPLHATGTPGEFVAGVKYRAWQPPSCLHPTIPVHTPLALDVIDEWNGRSIGGCVYHVSHPGGRSYEKLPINAHEAESRRLSRFQPFGHTPGCVLPRIEEINPAFPMTLDLRRPPLAAAATPPSKVSV